MKSIYWNARKKKEVEQVKQEPIQEQVVFMSPHDHGQDGGSGVEQDENKIYFYSQIGEKEVLELNKVVKRLDKEMQVLGITLNIPPPPIELHIHSEGGSAFAGLAAYDVIRSTKSPVHTYIDGCAASAATLLFLAGNKKYIHKNSFMLVHQLSATVLGGKYEEFKDELKNQEKLMHTVKNIYLEKGKLTEEQLTDLMKHDLWLDSETVMKYGFADEIIGV
jgi:ATP-dependent protease ClpP protease subunit